MPSSTSSGLPPTRVATTGSPLAIASRIVFEMPSASDGSTKQSSPRRISGTSARSPGSHASSRMPGCSSTRSTSARSGPSPTITRRSAVAVPDGADRADEGAGQGHLILDRLHPAHGADEPLRRR